MLRTPTITEENSHNNEENPHSNEVLAQIYAWSREKKRLSLEQLEYIILELCSVQPLKLKEFGVLLQRSENLILRIASITMYRIAKGQEVQ